MQNSYNIEISSNILISNNKPGVIIVNEIVLTVNNEYNYTGIYRRTFLDNNLDAVTIDLPICIDCNRLMDLLNNIHNENYQRKKWDLLYFNSCIAVDWSYEDKTYDIPMDSEIGKKIMEITLLDKYLKYSNQEIIGMINI